MAEEFPWAEAYPERGADQARQIAMQHDAFKMALGGLAPSGFGGGVVRGFGRLRPSQMRGPRPDAELAELLESLGGTAGPNMAPRPSFATPRIGRNPTGRPDLPSEELMPSLESPGGRRGFGKLAPTPPSSRPSFEAFGPTGDLAGARKLEKNISEIRRLEAMRRHRGEPDLDFMIETLRKSAEN